MEFKLHAPFQATGDQPEAIAALTEGVESGLDEQVLLGVTGSGKTFTMARSSRRSSVRRWCWRTTRRSPPSCARSSGSFSPTTRWNTSFPTTITTSPRPISPHGHLHRQGRLHQRGDRPPAPQRDLALLERRDVRRRFVRELHLRPRRARRLREMADDLAAPGTAMERDELIRRLVEDRYERNDVDFERNRFRVRGDAVDIYPAYWRDRAVRVEFFGDEIDAIREFHPVTGVVTETLQPRAVYPASHYVTTRTRWTAPSRRSARAGGAGAVLQGRRTSCSRRSASSSASIRSGDDAEMGFCSGIENYSRVIYGRPGRPPMTLLDYFPKDFLLLRRREPRDAAAGARHVRRRPRAQGHARCSTASACPALMTTARCASRSSRTRVHQLIYVSATPGDYEREGAQQIVEQVIRPTGLLDPAFRCGPSRARSTTSSTRSKARAARNERVLVTTLTKKMAEDLTDHLLDRACARATCTRT